MKGLEMDQHRIICRLNRIFGQISAVNRSLEQDDPYSEILLQLRSARRAAEGLRNQLLKGLCLESFNRGGYMNAEPAIDGQELIQILSELIEA